MALKNNRGWIATYFIFLLLLIITLISMGFSFQLQLNQEMKSDSLCRNELKSILISTRDDIATVFQLNPLADTLYSLQQKLKPFIWIPKIAALYSRVQALRTNLNTLQETMIRTLNKDLLIKSFQLYSKLQSDLENSKKTYQEYHHFQYLIQPASNFKMAIQKKRQDIFPSYKLEMPFEKKQEMKIPISIRSQAKSKQFVNQSYTESKFCHGSLKEDDIDKSLKIIYYKKSSSANFLW